MEIFKELYSPKEMYVNERFFNFPWYDRVPKCDVIILQTYPFKPHHGIETVGVRM